MARQWSFSVIPRRFLLVMPLNVGAEIIAFIALFNKASCFYALAALFNGHRLTVMEWVVNIITVVFIPFFALGFFAVRNKKPIATLAYAHLYIIDTFANLGFIIYFIVHWFTVGSKLAAKAGIEAPSMVNRTLHDAEDSVVDVVVRATVDAVLNKSATLGQELAVTIVCTTLILVTRFYFVIVILGYARSLVQHHNLRPRNSEMVGSFKANVLYILLSPFERFWTGHKSFSPRGAYQPVLSQSTS